MTAPPRQVLPSGVAPKGFRREQAAAYIGVKPTLFDAMVKDGRMPKPKRINSLPVWDRARLDAAFEALPDEDNTDDNPWDATCGLSSRTERAA